MRSIQQAEFQVEFLAGLPYLKINRAVVTGSIQVFRINQNQF
jgi:hypothetical protein